MTTTPSSAAEAVADLERATASFITATKQAGATWLPPRAPGKWNPSQVAEHVARSLEEAANDIEGKETRMLSLPFFLHPLSRILFNRVIRTGNFGKAKTNPAMNPDKGSDTPEEAARRLEEALSRLASTAHRHARISESTKSVVFGRVPLKDYIQFQAMHVAHHQKQLPA
jgi:hypothetical protein